MVHPEQVLSTVLRHDTKQTSYKIALLRAINDIVLFYPHVGHNNDVAIPLHRLAAFWIAYYWPFVHSHPPFFKVLGHNAETTSTKIWLFGMTLVNFGLFGRH